MAELLNGGTLMCHSRFHQMQVLGMELYGETECKACGFIARNLEFLTRLKLNLKPGQVVVVRKGIIPLLRLAYDQQLGPIVP